METNRIRQFCAVAETQNLRKASDLLNISHPGLFKSLKVLEAELGYALFRRHGRGVILTEEGKKLYPRAVKFIENYEVFLGNSDSKEEELRIGTFEVFSTYFLSQLLPEMVSGGGVLLQELIPGEMEKAVLDGTIDVAITYEPIPLSGLSVLEVGKMKMGVYSANRNFADESFSNWPFVIPAHPIREPLSEVKGLDGWQDHKLSRRVKYRVSLLETAMQLCSTGKAVGYLPAPVVYLFNQTRLKKAHLYELPHPRKVKQKDKKVYLILRDSSEESLAIKKIAKHLRQFSKLSV